MKNFEDHWREKMNDSDAQKDFLKEEVKAHMWGKIQSSKKKFEKAWQKKADEIPGWEGFLEQGAKQEIWDKLQIPRAKFEKNWREKIEEPDNIRNVFLNETGKERIAASVFAQKENFELEWQQKMQDPALAVLEDLPEAKVRIWEQVSSGILATNPASKEKRKVFFKLRWSHAAALLIGIAGAWFFLSKPAESLHKTIAEAPVSESVQQPVGPQIMPREEISLPEQDTEAPVNREQHNNIARNSTKAPLKDKIPVAAPQSRKLIEPVASRFNTVTPLKSEKVLAKSEPTLKTNHTKTTEVRDNGLLAPEKEIEETIATAAPVKRVVHISDIRPSEAHARGNSAYGRAFGENKEHREKSSMNLNSVLKNYK